MSIPKPSEILQRLIRFNTTNPPGHERACIEYLERLLVQADLTPRIVAQDPERPNLLVRVPGEGVEPGLMLFGHVDVVTTAGQAWSVPPFDGLIRDGMLWGRGALDMKAGIAMMISAVLALHASGHRPAGDVLFLAVSDEEAGGAMGARYMVESHAELFAGAKYALGEFGGFPLFVDGRPLYMIQLGEKQPCWIEATIRGPGGHGARPMRDGNPGEILVRLERPPIAHSHYPDHGAHGDVHGQCIGMAETHALQAAAPPEPDGCDPLSTWRDRTASRTPLSEHD